MPRHLAIPVDNRGGVVIDAGSASLEQRGNDDNLPLASDGSPSRSVVGPGIGSARSKSASPPLTEILGAKKLRQAHNLRALLVQLRARDLLLCRDWRQGPARSSSGSARHESCSDSPYRFRLQLHPFLTQAKGAGRSGPRPRSDRLRLLENQNRRSDRRRPQPTLVANR